MIYKIFQIQIFIFVLFCLFIGCTDWNKIEVNVQRGQYSKEGSFFSENIPKDILYSEIDSIIYLNLSPYPLKIQTARWKFLKKEPQYIEWGYEIVLKNNSTRDSIYVIINSINFKLFDKDEFSLGEDSINFNTILVLEKTKEYQFKDASILHGSRADKLAKVKAFLTCSIHGFSKGKWNEDDLYSQANEFMSKEKWSEAERRFIKILELYPNGKYAAKSIFMIGFVNSNYLGNNKKAEIYYTLFLKKYPDNELVDDAKYELQNLGKRIDELF